MKAELMFSPKSLEDMDNITEYISGYLHNPAAAKTIIDGILGKLESLQSFPEIGSKLMLSGNIFSGYRWVSYKNYIAFYHLEKNTVYVDRVLNSQQNYLKILFQDNS